MSRDLVRIAASVDRSVADALEAALDAAADAVDSRLLDLVTARIGLLLGDEPDLPRLAAGELSQADHLCLRLVEQFVLDVSAVTDKDVGDVAELMSDREVYGLVAALYMFELTRRVELVLGAALDGGSDS